MQSLISPLSYALYAWLYTYVDSSGLASLALTMNSGKATANMQALWEMKTTIITYPTDFTS